VLSDEVMATHINVYLCNYLLHFILSFVLALHILPIALLPISCLLLTLHLARVLDPTPSLQNVGLVYWGLDSSQ
jgi:hypothetical protein